MLFSIKKMKYFNVFSSLFFVFLFICVQSTFLKNKQNLATNDASPATSDASPTTQDASATQSASPVAEASSDQSQKAVDPNDPKEGQTDTQNVEVIDAFCFINNGGIVYDLNGLKSDNDYKINTIGGFVSFNICQDQKKPCENQKGIASFTSNRLGEQCSQIAGVSSVSSKFFIIEDKENAKVTLRMKLPEGEACKANTNKKYQTLIDFTCDPTAELAKLSTDPINLDNCETTIYVESKFACAKYDVYGLWNSIKSNKWLFGAIIIGLGIFFCFFGENFLKITQVIAGAALSLVIFLYFVFNYTVIEINSWQFWVVIIIAIGVGCLFGFFMAHLTWLPGLVFGALLGFVLGFVIFNLALRFIESNPNVVFWVTMSVCFILGCLLGFWKEEEIAIISTAIVGGYAIVRGISVWAGGFPDERQVYELGSKGEWEQMRNLLTGVVYAYLAGFVVLSALGMIIQFKFFYDGNKKKNNEEEKQKNNKDGDLVNNEN
jgi:hypothetical protein